MSGLSIEGFLASRPAEKPSAGLLSPGDLVGEWRVAAFVGAGRSAEVYRVVNTRLGGEAALKILSDASSGLRERFGLEMDAVRTLAVSSLPRFFGSGTRNGMPYYVMEYLQPLVLPLPAGEVVPFMTSLAAAVAELHAAGFVHRDLKPANVLLRRGGRPVLIDLGLVKRIGDATRPSRGSLSVVDGKPVGVGTPGFAAPEQLIDGVATERSDVFALGEMLRACCGGKMGRELRRVLRQATAADPEDRYPDAVAFGKAVAATSERKGRVPLVAAASACALALAYLLVSNFQTSKLPNSTTLNSSTLNTPTPNSSTPNSSTHNSPTPNTPTPTPHSESLTRQPGESEMDHMARILSAAEEGSAEAQTLAAEGYYYGRGVEKDAAEAVRLYRLAADANHPGAQVSLGNCLLRGIGCERNPDEAVAWLSRAASQGNLGAMNDLAFCFRNGIGVDKDDTEAFLWAMKAAESGHPGAQAFVGECYLEGYGVEVNQRRADDWLQRAARQGNERAKMLLRTR